MSLFACVCMCRVEYVDYIRNEYKVTTKELFQHQCPPTQGSHSDWKTWKNGKAFSSQGKVREF